MTTPATPQPAAGWPGPTPDRPRSSPLRWIIPTLVVLVAIVAGLLGGILIGRHTAAAAAPGAHPGTGQYDQYGGAGRYGTSPTAGSTPGAFGGGAFVSGTVTAVHGSTLTVTTQQGTTETITVPSSASVTATQRSSLGALKAGQHVTVTGTPGSSSGSMTATRVAEGQSGFGGGRGARTPGGN